MKEFTLINYILIIQLALVKANNDDINYSPGYIGALNSTIVNLMSQLQTYQQYIDQAFQPLQTYDKVFPKASNEFNPTPAPIQITGTTVKSNNQELEAEEYSVDSDIKEFSRLLAANTAKESTPEVRKSSPQTSSKPGQGKLTFVKNDENKFVIPIDSRKEELKSISSNQNSLRDQECGNFDSSTAQATDAGGHITWPWSVKVGKDVSKGFLYKCGGTLITNQHVLTSAHCVSGGEKEVDAIHYFGKKFKFAKITSYPEYNENIGYHDIAIIKLAEPLLIINNTKVTPACITFDTNLRISLEHLNEFSWTTEWKISNKNRKLSFVIRNLFMKIQDNKICEDKYKKEFGPTAFNAIFPKGFDVSLICAKSIRQKICQKNNGNALLTRDRVTQKSYILGVVINGEDSCLDEGNKAAELPAIFTRVSYYKNWIPTVVDEIDHQKTATDEKQVKDYLYYD